MYCFRLVFVCEKRAVHSAFLIISCKVTKKKADEERHTVKYSKKRDDGHLLISILKEMGEHFYFCLSDFFFDLYGWIFPKQPYSSKSFRGMFMGMRRRTKCHTVTVTLLSSPHRQHASKLIRPVQTRACTGP